MSGGGGGLSSFKGGPGRVSFLPGVPFCSTRGRGEDPFLPGLPAQPNPEAGEHALGSGAWVPSPGRQAGQEGGLTQRLGSQRT